MEVDLVYDALNPRWSSQLPREINDIELDTTCGRRIEAITTVADALLLLVAEPDTRAAIIAAVVADILVIVNG